MPGLRFDLATAARIAHSMACAARHLHRQGILHGDLYAHNILHDEEGQALLGDLGAASFIPPAWERKPPDCNDSRCAHLAACLKS